jgi:phenylalanyl-tRNA synthetase alpha chain
MKHRISENQWLILSELKKAQQPVSIQEIQETTTIDQSQIASTFRFAEEQAWVTVSEQNRIELSAGEELTSAVDQGLPERRAIRLMRDQGFITMAELAKAAKTDGFAVNEVVKWGTQRQWLSKEGAELRLTETGRAQLDTLSGDEELLIRLSHTPLLFVDELPALGFDFEALRPILEKRTNLIRIKARTVRRALFTPAGEAAMQGEIEVIRERTTLSAEEIGSGEWKNLTLRRYDVTLPTERIFPAKVHLMQKIIAETRRAFLEMGFTEVVSPMVESAFWDFDALFQPQDHPARDMQDTFYLENPALAGLPAHETVQRVKATHENGGDTGSCGWGYQWSEEKARQNVLRTHCTATSIRALAADPSSPRKVFCVGKVFRNESISYKHLPEFFQVDGMIIDEKASFTTLLGTLQKFYQKMGFSQVRFKPSFFPYTEPSADINAYMESRDKWMEMGGAGIFRPEVTRPFGCKVPVLAWGLGLDRLAMLRYGISDIRELYWSDLEKITEVPLCR